MVAIYILICSKYVEFSFVERVLSLPPSLLVVKISEIFGNYYIVGFIFTMNLFFSFLPSLGVVRFQLFTFGSYFPEYVQILLFGYVCSESDDRDEINEKLKEKERYYKRFFLYLKCKNIKLSFIVNLFLQTILYSFVFAGIFSIPFELKELDRSCLYIKDVFSFHIEIALIVWAFLIFRIIKTIKSSFTKKNKIINLILLSIVFIASIRNSFIFFILLSGVLSSAFKKIGGKINVAKNNKENR